MQLSCVSELTGKAARGVLGSDSMNTNNWNLTKRDAEDFSQGSQTGVYGRPASPVHSAGRTGGRGPPHCHAISASSATPRREGSLFPKKEITYCGVKEVTSN